MKNNQKWLGVLLVIVIVGVLVIGGVYLYTKDKKIPQLNSNTQATSTTEISSWKTYLSSALGIQVKYPQDWQYHVYNDSQGYFSLGPNESDALVTFQTSSTESILDGIPVSVGGRVGVKKSSTQIGTVISVSKGDGMFLVISGPPQVNKEFERIVASIEFIK